MKKLAIITVNYHNAKDTVEFVNSFQQQTNKNFHIFVIDLSEKPDYIAQNKILTIVSAENKGYAYGLNTGLRVALQEGYEHFVFINNDTLVSRDFVSSVFHAIDNYPASLIGGKIYYQKGYEYHKDRYESSELGRVLWYAGGIVDWNNVYTLHRGVDEIDTGQYDTCEETQFITGCLMCFDKTLIDKVGMMDEQYFLYYEDADWCERIKKNRLHLYYDPRIVIYHKNSQSTGGSGSQLHVDYQSKNRLRFGMKYAPFKTKLHLIKNLLTNSTVLKNNHRI